MSILTTGKGKEPTESLDLAYMVADEVEYKKLHPSVTDRAIRYIKDSDRLMQMLDMVVTEAICHTENSDDLKAFIVDIIIDVKNAMEAGEYASWSDFTVEKKLPLFLLNGKYTDIAVMGEEKDHMGQYFSVWLGTGNGSYSRSEHTVYYYEDLPVTLEKYLRPLWKEDTTPVEDAPAPCEVPWFKRPSAKEVLDYLLYLEDANYMYPFAVLPKDVTKKQLDAIAESASDTLDSIFAGAKRVLGDNPAMEDEAEWKRRYAIWVKGVEQRKRLYGLCEHIAEVLCESYHRTARHIIVVQDDRDFIYPTTKEFLKDWITPVIEYTCDGNDEFWNSFPFILEVLDMQLPGIVPGEQKEDGVQCWKASAEIELPGKGRVDIPLGTYLHMTDAITTQHAFITNAQKMSNEEAILELAESIRESAEDLYAHEQHDPTLAFSYGGVKFIPVGYFPKEMSFKDIVYKLRMDPELGFCTKGYAQAYTMKCNFPYEYEAFMAASSVSDADVFFCAETGRNYVPCTNDLQVYTGPFHSVKT